MLWQLSDSSLRYNELRRRLKGITNTMLTRSSKRVREEYSLINRVQLAEDIPSWHKLEISTSKQGKTISSRTKLIIKDWGEQISIRE